MRPARDRGSGYSEPRDPRERLSVWPQVVAAASIVLLAISAIHYLLSPAAAPARTGADSWLFAAGAITIALSVIIAYQSRRAMLKAQRAERSYRNIYEGISEGVFRCAPDCSILSANPALVRLNGYVTESELIAASTGHTGKWYVDPKRAAEIHAMLLEQGQVTNLLSEVYRRKTRERIWVEESIRLVRDANGEPAYFEGNVREVTETVNRLKLQDRYDKIASIMSGCLYQNRMRPNGHTSMPYASIGLYHMLGIRPEEVAEESNRYRDMIHPDDFDRVTQAVLRSRDTLTPLQCEYRMRLADGKEKWVFAHSVPEREADGSTLWHGYLVDATEKKASEAKIYELAYFDTLTHLPNRAFLGNRLHRILSYNADPTHFRALLFVDLDHFKVLNDTKGHHVGDQLLCEISKRIVACVGPDDLVSRLGGDEFVVLLDEPGDKAHSAAMARRVGESILATIDQPFRIDESTFQTTASIGAVVFSSRDHDAEAVLKHADLAMYEAKAAGRGTLRFFQDDMQVAAADRLALTSQLRHARESGGLLLFYQPLVEGRGRCVGAEALLRWNHPTRGLISAGEFIALAERSGFMNSIDTWVLRAACTTLKSWEDDPLTRGLSLSVNVSAREMNSMAFAETVESVLAETGARPDRLTLEITEHVMLDDFDEVNAVMQRLQALGLHFALDDFGTGYSSLSYLKRLPIDALKIDRSFVRDLESDESDREIVQTILNVARSLKISVVAEGVETDLQAMLLRQLGCHVFQGYLFGKPMPPTAFKDYLEEQAAENAAAEAEREHRCRAS